MSVERSRARNRPTECCLCGGETGVQGPENRTSAVGWRVSTPQRTERSGVGALSAPATPRGDGRRAATGVLTSSVCLHNSAASTDKSGGFGSLHTCLVGSRPPAGGTTSRRMSSMNSQRLHSACSVSERAKLCAAVLMCAALVACARDRVTAVYGPGGAIRRIDYDTDRDGRIDIRAYLLSGRTIRIEADGNGDGVVDRWEYYGASGGLDRLGTSCLLYTSPSPR